MPLQLHMNLVNLKQPDDIVFVLDSSIGQAAHDQANEMLSVPIYAINRPWNRLLPSKKQSV